MSSTTNANESAEHPGRLAEIHLRRLRHGDAGALARFYNGLSQRSKCLFRPLGETTTVEQCAPVVRDNAPGGSRFDIVASLGGEIVGWCFLWSLDRPPPTFGLCVADAMQGGGLGGRLADRVLERARAYCVRQVELTVVQDNERALGMYERRGFRRCDAFLGQDGLPYYRMRLKLGEP